MKLHLLLVCALICLMQSQPLHAQSYRAILTGRGEVPPLLTTAYGEVDALLVGDTLIISGYFRDLSGDFAHHIAGGSHIHGGYAGRNGGVLHSLNATVDSTQLNGSWEPDSNRIILTAEQIAALNERSLYINVHTDFSNSGEIRGQLMPSADAFYATNMAGSYENPAVPTRARGAIVLDLLEDTLTVSGSFSDLSSEWNGGLHLHLGIAGMNGPVSIPLTATADSTNLNGIIRAADNRVTLTAEQKTALAERRLYANVHSMRYGSGEIRGQVTPVVLAVFRGHLSGMNENPFVPTRAGGMVIAELGPNSSLTLSGSFAGMQSKVATDIAGGSHIHQGVAGRNGGILFQANSDLNIDSTGGVFSADSNSFSLSSLEMTMLMSRGLYLNVHSNLIRSGEIRGQLLPESQMVFNANSSSVTSIPEVRSAAAGIVKGELNGHELTLTGSVAGLSSDIDTSIAGGAHLHMALAGSTGPVVFPLNLRFDAPNQLQAVLGENVFTLDDEQLSSLLEREFYVNFHTHRYPAGEIRGQLLPEANTYFVASLAGGNETMPVKSEGSGQVILEYQRNGATAISGSFNNLEGELAITVAGGMHIHAGLNGQNGPVLVPIVNEPSPDTHAAEVFASDNLYTFSTERADSLYDLGMYVNVHSSFAPGGELRGQLLPIANAHLNAVLRPMNEVQPIPNNPAHGAVSAMLFGNVVAVTGSFAELQGDFAHEVAGGAHIHNGRAGFNGSVVVPLATIVANDLKSGIFKEDTVYMLLPEQVNTLLAGGYYVNIHTTTQPGGELRGQLLSSFNEFPDATSVITQPVPNSTVTVSSTNHDPLVISWTPSMDSDSLAYIVQVTPDPTFTQIPIMYNTGNQRSFSVLTLAYIDTLLANFGVPIGFPISVNARIIASDGSLQSIGQAFNFTLVREPPSSVRDLPEGWSFEVYPTISQDMVNVEVVSPGGTPELVLIGANGVQSLLENVNHSVGALSSLIDVKNIPAGMWVVGLMHNGQLIGQRKVLVIR